MRVIKRVRILLGACLMAAMMLPTIAMALQLSVVGAEELVSGNDSRCSDSTLFDSPARALRRSDGTILLYATHYNNWYMKGKDWNSLKVICGGSSKGGNNPDPSAVDDRFWIQALASDDGKSVQALASEEYLGVRHGRCNTIPTKNLPFPCWYSSIIQLESRDGGLVFRRPAHNAIVATPQVPFNEADPARVGFLTTSNIVRVGRYKYALVYVQGYGEQATGTCIFRSLASNKAEPWVAWEGKKFAASLSKVPVLSADGKQIVTCAPLALGSINRALVRHNPTGTWLAIGPYTNSQEGDGIYYSTSFDLLHWTTPKLLVRAVIKFSPPDCPAVFKYPSIIDHNAVGASFDQIGSDAYLYAVKVLFVGCKYAGRSLVRMRLNISM